MDFPKTDHLTSTLTTDSEATATPTIPISPPQSPSDSFSDFVNNLFPIEPGSSDFAAPGLTGLESSPFVFSPPSVESNLLKRAHNSQSSNAELVAESQECNSKDPCIIYQDCLDFRPQSFHECNSKETFGGAFQMLQQPLSVPQPLHGMSQHYLQFKEASANAPLNSFPSNFTSNVKATSYAPEFSVLKLDAAFNNRVSANSSRFLRTLLHLGSVGNPRLGISKPSGTTGLHLNNIIDIVMKKHGPVAGLGMQGLSPHILKNEKTCSGNVSLTSSITLNSCHAVKAEKFKTPYETRNFDSNQPSNVEKINNFHPKRKRRKSSVNNSSDDSKRCCKCTKTKCLKLYCDCFAAGMYCRDSCSCQLCFNKPESVHIVLERRNEIESRDPFAFSPRVIEDRNELPVNNENGSLSIPSLARHKKGCKCKKSMCSKQYCECFQANVGCSDRCRCENCKNVHGKRGELATGRADVGRRLVGRLIDDYDATAALRKGVLHSEFYGQQHNFAPQTPSFQYSDHEKDSPKSRFMSRRCLPSPEFDSTSSSSPANSDIFVETKTEMLDVNCFKWPHMNCDHVGTSLRFIPSKPRGCTTNISRIGELRIGSSSILCPRSLDTPLVQAGNMTSINCINGSSPEKKVVLPPLYGNENEVGMNNSLRRLKSHRYILKSMPPFAPLTPRNK